MSFILASGSESRRAILSAAGVVFQVVVPQVDEATIKARMCREGAVPAAIALALAEAKARRVSGSHRDRLVLGCDQLLLCKSRLFDKAIDVAAAREVLLSLRGKKHMLATAAVLVRGDAIVWRHIAMQRLWMRRFSDEFLDTYLVDEGEDILGAVGCYRVEGRGAQLFERIEGDQFSIRGLPLIPLLAVLREHGELAS